jgi:ankyrin repeat protein
MTAALWTVTRSHDIDRQFSGRHGSALQAAAYNGQIDTVDFLIARGANVNDYAGYYGTALQAAAVAGCLSIVERLLREGAHVNTLTGFYGNPLQAAAAGGHVQIANVFCRQVPGSTPEGVNTDILFKLLQWYGIEIVHRCEEAQ